MLDFKALAAQTIMKEIAAKIHDLKPEQITKLLIEAFKHEIDALKGDADKNGIVDFKEIEDDLAVAGSKLGHAAHLIHLAHQAQGK